MLFSSRFPSLSLGKLERRSEFLADKRSEKQEIGVTTKRRFKRDPLEKANRFLRFFQSMHITRESLLTCHLREREKGRTSWNGSPVSVLRGRVRREVENLIEAQLDHEISQVHEIRRVGLGARLREHAVLVLHLIPRESLSRLRRCGRAIAATNFIGHLIQRSEEKKNKIGPNSERHGISKEISIETETEPEPR